MTVIRMNRLEERMVQTGDKKGAFESMLSRFNRQVHASGIFRELKDLKYFEKPSDKKRRKHREAVARIRKEQRDAIRRRKK